MKIQDLLRKDIMILDLQAISKEVAIDEMITKLVEKDIVHDFDVFKKSIMTREEQTSTGLGDGIAMPHSKNIVVDKPAVLFAKSNKGVDYKALDGQPTDLFFMIAAPQGANDTHLAALAELSQYLLKDGFADKLRAAATPEAVIAVFDEASTAKEEVVAPTSGQDFIVAVTACPTGIAHTYMAEEALKKQAAEMGVAIKVETNGASGVANRLTAEDIQRAKGVIVAADKAVEMDRFDGKQFIARPVADGIKKSQELISLILNNEGNTYHAKNGKSETAVSTEKTSLGGAFYKHLMGGVSQMLPFVIGGGIMIALAFLLDNMLGVPNDQLGSLGSYHEIAAIFMNIGGAAFSFMLPVLAGYIAYSIAEKPGLVAGFVAGAIASNGLAFGKVPFAAGGEVSLGLTGVPSGFLGALVGGMMAVDMGGPVNKAAYVFGTGTLAATVANGGSVVMAAVMAGGMVPPLAVFVATLLFKDKFTKEERESGLTNIVMGLSFITEGAIPFGAADPARAIPSFIAGSALTGALVGLAGIKLMAPHGGIFVIALTSNPILYLVFVAIGAIVSGILFGALRKKA
ncbi:TPA: PTS sugar transporter subunit IIA [Streptococcus pyogenes]|nr:PTS sugar transporter subunit IIA [Streptococcus pyogenes]